MDKKVLTLAGVIAAVSVGTYAVLTLVKPHKHEEVKVADVYSADQIFAGQVNPNGPDEPPVDGAPVQSAVAAEPAPAEQAAAAPAAESAAPTSTDAMTTPVEGEATPAATPAPVESTPAAPAQQMTAAEPAAPAAAEPAPAATPAPVEPAAELAPAAAPAPQPAKPKHAAAPKKKPKPAVKATTANVVKAWWPAENPNQLSLIYAGPASFKKAIVLMFNGAFFKPESPNANLKVTDSKGMAVAGTWELGENNRRMLVFPISASGVYKVAVGAGLTDSKDRKLGSALSGAVVIP